MLLTTRVGGLGVNLTGANRVVIYDPDWNPATDTQARERAWRIGQTKDVTIYRLITAGTIEEKIYHRQIYKQFLSNKVLKDPKQRRFFKSNDIMELFNLSETIKGGTTETAAIFAGTGSEVTIEQKSEARKSGETNGLSAKTNQEMPITFSQTKIEEMKKRALELSKKIGAFKAQNQDSVYGPDGALLPMAKKEQNNNEEQPKGEAKVIVSDTTKQTSSDNSCIKGCDPCSSHSLSLTDNSCKKNSTKKKSSGGKKNHKKEKYASFEGKNVPHLVKCKSVRKKKSKEETHVSQDDYVLKKLFSKSGIETALKHDNIMEGGPSDYAIVEAEAEKVAQEAIKALRESRNQMPSFKNRSFRTGIKKQNMTDSLINKMKERNMDFDPGVPEKNLLKDVIDWLCSQGGTATTQQLIDQFSHKVQGGKSPLFKSLLKNIAHFYRAPDNLGYWTIRDEFK